MSNYVTPIYASIPLEFNILYVFSGSGTTTGYNLLLIK
jgi:hypothetical protein